MLKNVSIPLAVKDSIRMTQAIVVVGLNPTIARYGEACSFVGTLFFCIRFLSLFVFRWKASMHNLVGQIQTRDTLLDQCKNLRRIFDEYVANYMISFPTSNTKEAYEAVTSPKSRSASDLSPAEKMLRAANFTYMKKPNSTVGSMWEPCTPTFVPSA